MKVKQKKEFNPVTIVLETQEELDLMRALSNGLSTSDIEDCFEISGMEYKDVYDRIHTKLYNQLKEI